MSEMQPGTSPEGLSPDTGDRRQEEWPPREWRETTRSVGHRQALYVALAMVAIFIVLVLINTWGAHQG